MFNKTTVDRLEKTKKEKGRILLVSDSKKLSNDIIQHLAEKEYKIMIEKNGFSALERLKNTKIDIIITRLKMPSMDGLELIMNIKDLNIDSPIIIIEENNKQNDESYALTKILGFCCKPKIKKSLIEITNIISPYDEP